MVSLLVEQRIRAALDISARAQYQAELWEMATGEWRPSPEAVGPRPRTEEALEAWGRLSRLVAPVGPQILRTRLSGAVYQVQWSDAGRGSARLDAALEALDLHDLAAALFTQAFVTGVAAVGVVLQDGKPRLAKIGGYLEPLLDPDDVEVVTGLLQAWVSSDERRARRGWNVRIYDYQERVVREWRNLPRPEEAFREPPSSETGVAYLPHTLITYRGADGLPIGELGQGRNLIAANYAIQLRIQRVAELYGFPIPVVIGQADIPRDWGPGRAITIPSGQGGFVYAFPEGLPTLYELLERNLAAIREFFALPGGSLGSQTPSGEALREANRKFVQASAYYAQKLSQTLTMAVRDYASAVGVSHVAVEVVPHDMGSGRELLASVVTLYKEGVVPLEVAARVAQMHVPSWSDEELREWVQRQQGLATPEVVARLLGGGE